GGTARSVTRLSWPLTRGSTTTLRPVMVAMVRATASISALAKFSVTGSLGRTLPVAVLIAVWARICPLTLASKALAAIVLIVKRRRGEIRKVIVGLPHGNDGARAVAPSDDVQEIRQRCLAFRRRTRFAGKA